MAAEQPSPFFELRHAATDRATIVVVPERRFLAIDGVGGPTAAGFRFATETLRSAAEQLRIRLAWARRPGNQPAAIECAWWIHPEIPDAEMPDAFGDRSKWHWQQMIEIPMTAEEAETAAAIDETRRQAGREVPLIRTTAIEEGRAAQILHVGPLASEPASLRKLYKAIADAGLRPRGHLHQILLTDPDRVAPERARSILRLPVEPA